jgi:hypothetical protein
MISRKQKYKKGDVLCLEYVGDGKYGIIVHVYRGGTRIDILWMGGRLVRNYSVSLLEKLYDVRLL